MVNDLNGDRVQAYEAPDGWRWRRIAPNNEIIATGQAYTTRWNAKVGAARANDISPDMVTVVAVTDDGTVIPSS